MITQEKCREGKEEKAETGIPVCFFSTDDDDHADRKMIKKEAGKRHFLYALKKTGTEKEISPFYSVIIQKLLLSHRNHHFSDTQLLFLSVFTCKLFLIQVGSQRSNFIVSGYFFETQKQELT